MNILFDKKNWYNPLTFLENTKIKDTKANKGWFNKVSTF